MYPLISLSKQYWKCLFVLWPETSRILIIMAAFVKAFQRQRLIYTVITLSLCHLLLDSSPQFVRGSEVGPVPRPF